MAKQVMARSEKTDDEEKRRMEAMTVKAFSQLRPLGQWNDRDTAKRLMRIIGKDRPRTGRYLVFDNSLAACGAS